nr:T9SS type A sorting domain-containing protein [candidate division Zixibacteria bacterium]
MSFDPAKRTVQDKWTDTYTSSYTPEDPEFGLGVLRPFCLTNGDLNNDGKDELISAAYDSVKIYQLGETGLFEEIAAIGIINRIGDDSRRTVVVEDFDADTLSLEWRKELIISDYGPDDGQYRIRIFAPVVNDSTKALEGFTFRAQWAAENVNGSGSMAIAAGDLDGDAIMLGSPNHYIIDSMVQPLIIFNAPPTHFDIFTGTYDINNCYSGATCQFYGQYSEEGSVTYGIETEVHSDWAVSAEASASTVLWERGVEAHISAEYGQNFENVVDTTKTIKISQSVTAQKDDWLYATISSYDVWEYPVMIKGLQKSHVVAVIPKAVQDSWFPSKSWRALTYAPDHEVGNILSYPDFDNLLDNPDAFEVFTTGQWLNSYGVFPSSDYYWSLSWDRISNSGKSAAWDMGIEAGLSVKGGWYSVSVEGEYGMGEVSTHSSSVSKNIMVDVGIGGIDEGLAEAGYHVTPYAYHANNGALIVDYTVTPESSPTPGLETWWDLHYGSAPDLSFIRPWKYDPEKGIHLEYDTKRHLTKDISFTPAYPDPGDTVTITARIRNFSLIPSPSMVPVMVSFYVGDPDNGGTIIIDIYGNDFIATTDSLAPRGFVTAQMKWLYPDGLVQNPWIFAVVDPLDNISEVHEDNNKGFNILFAQGAPVDVEDIENLLTPNQFILAPNYPNPFNPVTTIEYALPTRSEIELVIYNILGQKIKTLVDGEESAGYHLVQWDGTGFNGRNVASGIYFYRLRAGDYNESRKMILLK